MKWIIDLLRKHEEPLAASPLQAPASVPAVDTDQLRREMQTAAGDAERIRIAGDLGQALSAQSKAPLNDDPPEVWVAATCCATDKALALDWTAALTAESWLAEVASYARLAEVRLAAAMRIGDTGLLEQVAHTSRDRDKGVYRHCAEVLRQRRQTGHSAHRAMEIAGELQALLEHAPMPLSRLLALKKELDGLGEGAAAVADCRKWMDQALARLHDESEARRLVHLRQQEASDLLSELAGAEWPWQERLQGWRSSLDELTPILAGLPAWLAAEAPGKAFAQTMHKTGHALAARSMDAECVLACEQFLATLAPDVPPGEDATNAWAALPKPDNIDALASLKARYQTLLAIPVAGMPVPKEKPAKPRPHIDQALVSNLLEKLEGETEQGRLGEADATVKQIKATLADNSLHGALDARLQAALAHLDKLHGWARWGTGQAREHLIAAADALLVGEHVVDELAVAIPALREEWKRLNAHAPAANEQWKHFDATLEKAYRPVAVLRAEEAARHAEARAVKAALCDACEAWMNGIDWDHADFKAIEAHRDDIRRQWRAAPQTAFRDERPLRKRYDKLLGVIDEKITAARSTEKQRREQLITAAEALVEAKDLGQAMTQARVLQGQWQQATTPVRLERGDEQKLWQRFRTACNAVFARRDTLRAEQTAQRQEKKQARQALLDSFATTMASADANGLRQALARFRTDWTAFRPAAREDADGLDARAADLQRQAQQRIDDLHLEKHRSRFDLLARKAALADRVQAAALAGEQLEETVAAAKQSWTELPALPGKAEKLLLARFDAAPTAAAVTLAEGREARAALLLDLEIALDLPTPESFAEARRERQLKRLQDRFGAGAAVSAEAEELLIRWYAIPATADAVLDRRLDAVVRKLASRGAPSGR